MGLGAKKIIGLKTYTQSEKYLGKVTDFKIALESFKITKIYIGSEILGFLKKPLIIDISQVISITNERMIVVDGVVAEKIVAHKSEPNMQYVK